MSEWTEWIYLPEAGKKLTEKEEELNGPGIYKIRMVDLNKNPNPISLGRFGVADNEGIIYIGSTRRKIITRVRKFSTGLGHSGGKTYREVLKTGKLKKHRLQVRGKIEKEEKALKEERKLLKNYINEHGELPPCNKSLPRESRELKKIGAGQTTSPFKLPTLIDLDQNFGQE